MSGKQIEFPPKQTHVKAFEYAMLVICDRARYRRPGDRVRHEHRRRVPTHCLSSTRGTRLQPRRRRGHRRRARVEASATTRGARAPTRPSSGSPSSSACSAFAFFVVRGCQNNQIKLTQAQAVELAQKQVDFKSETTQIRLLRQGLSRHPFWVVSLSIPFNTPDDPRGFEQLAVVRIDATTGEVASVENQGPSEPGPTPGPASNKRTTDRNGSAVMRVLVLQHIACEHPGVFTRGDARARRRGDRGRGRRGRAASRLARVRRGAGDGRADGRRRRRRPPVARAERELVREAVEAGRPFLGVCLGVQLLAAALGAPRLRGRAPGGRPARRSSSPPRGATTRSSRGLADRLVSLQWHGDTFDLPADAVRLASSPRSPTRRSGSASAPTGSSSTSRSPARWRVEWARSPPTASRSPRRSARRREPRSSPRSSAASAELHPPARRLFANWLELAEDAA